MADIVVDLYVFRVLYSLPSCHYEVDYLCATVVSEGLTSLVLHYLIHFCQHVLYDDVVELFHKAQYRSAACP